MFSHIAEETTRLSHGFLGALFSLVIIMTPGDVWPIVILCFSLYAFFFLNSAALHFLYRAVVENRTEAVFAVTGISIILGIMAFGFFVTYGMGAFVSFELEYIEALRIGLVIFFAFIVLMNIAHVNEIVDLRHRNSA